MIINENNDNIIINVINNNDCIYLGEILLKIYDIEKININRKWIEFGNNKGKLLMSASVEYI